MNLVKSVGAGTALLCIPVLAMILPEGFSFDQWPVWLCALLIALVGDAILLWLVPRSVGLSWRICCGSLVGFGIPVVGGLVLMQLVGGFESAALFASGLALGVPSALGGALAAFIQSRSAVTPPNP